MNTDFALFRVMEGGASIIGHMKVWLDAPDALAQQLTGEGETSHGRPWKRSPQKRTGRTG